MGSPILKMAHSLFCGRPSYISVCGDTHTHHTHALKVFLVYRRVVYTVHTPGRIVVAVVVVACL